MVDLMGGHEPRQSTDQGCLDELFVALGHRQRRLILLGLLERSSIEVDRLLPTGDDGDADRERLAVEFHHSHLPKLDERGYVEWDGGERVYRGPKFEKVADVIELLDEHRNRLPGEWP